MVLSQHPSEVVPEPRPMLEGLQQALQTLEIKVDQPVQLYLKVAGQKQPYATHSFTLDLPVSLPVDEPSELEKIWDTLDSLDDEIPAEEVTNLDGNEISKASSGWLGKVALAPNLSSEPSKNSSDWLDKVVPAENLSFKVVPVKRDRQFKLPLPILVAGACVALAASLKGVYLLKSACVIGDCEPIQMAQQLSQESTIAARQAKSQQQLKAAQQQLAQATVALQAIPHWSPRYQEAQDLSQNLSTLSATLNQAVTALQKASVAAQTSQYPSHTVQQWQVIQTLWQEAITLLEAVPHNSVLAPLAQQKLPGYRASLKSVNQQLNAEQQAAKKLTKALETARNATTRQGAAQSLQNWQQVQSMWQVAVNELASIPKGSTVYKEAQQLLGTYRPKLAAVSDRTTKEQISAKAYNQVVSLATLAKNYEQQNQLTTAVNNWTQALNFVKQVPSETFYYNKAQFLIDSYSSALNQAEEKLRVANVLQKARADLNRTCSGDLRVCNYLLNNQGISVRLTSDYEQAVERILKTAAASGDSNTQAAVAQHYQTLQQALEAISYNANLPLQFNDAKGSSIYTFMAQEPQNMRAGL